MVDWTYDKDVIKRNPKWHVAWVLSEILNGEAPIGWGRYIFAAECLLAAFEMKPKEEEPRG